MSDSITCILFQEEIRHTDTNSKLLHGGYINPSETNIEINITQSVTDIHITKAEEDMNI